MTEEVKAKTVKKAKKIKAQKHYDIHEIRDAIIKEFNLKQLKKFQEVEQKLFEMLSQSEGGNGHLSYFHCDDALEQLDDLGEGYDEMDRAAQAINGDADLTRNIIKFVKEQCGKEFNVHVWW